MTWSEQVRYKHVHCSGVHRRLDNTNSGKALKMGDLCWFHGGQSINDLVRKHVLWSDSWFGRNLSVSYRQQSFWRWAISCPWISMGYGFTLGVGLESTEIGLIFFRFVVFKGFRTGSCVFSFCGVFLFRPRRGGFELSVVKASKSCSEFLFVPSTTSLNVTFILPINKSRDDCPSYR